MKKKFKSPKIFTNKESRKTISSFFIGVVTTSLIFSFINNNKMMINVTPQKVVNSPIIAKVNGVEIYVSEINEKLAAINPQLKNENIKPEDRELLAKEIYTQKIILKNALRSSSYKEYSQALRKFAIQETKSNYLKSASEKSVSDKEAKAKYQELVDSLKGKKEYFVSHVLVKDKKTINKVRSYLKNNSFEAAAKKFSTDTNSAKNGGQLGYMIEGSTIKEFEDEVKKLKKNKTSRPFKTSVGWHIVKVGDIRDVSPAKYEEVQDKVKSSLAQEAKKALILDITKDAKVEIL